MKHIFFTQPVLYLSDTHCAFWSGKKQDLWIVLPNTPSQNMFLREELRAYANTSILIIINKNALEIKSTELPPLGLWDRKLLAKERLEQTFSKLSFCKYWFQTKTNLTLAGITPDSSDNDWFFFFNAHKITTTVSLLPIEIHEFITSQLPHTKNEWIIILTQEMNGQWRQIVSHKHSLLFSRVIPLSLEEKTDLEIAKTIAKDLESTQIYITRHGFQKSDFLNLCLVGDENISTIIEGLAKSYIISSFTPADIFPVSGTEIDSNSPKSADMSFVHLFSSQKPKHTFTQLEKNVLISEQSITKTGWILCLFAWTFFAFSNSQALYIIAQLGLNNAKSSEHIKQLQNEWASTQQKLAKETSDLSILQSAVEHKRIFSASVHQPWDNVDCITHSFDNAAKISKLAWHSSASEGYALKMNVHFLEFKNTPHETDALIQNFKNLEQILRNACGDGVSVHIDQLPIAVRADQVLTTTDPKGDKTATFSLHENVK